MTSSSHSEAARKETGVCKPPTRFPTCGSGHRNGSEDKSDGSKSSEEEFHVCLVTEVVANVRQGNIFIRYQHETFNLMPSAGQILIYAILTLRLNTFTPNK